MKNRYLEKIASFRNMDEQTKKDLSTTAKVMGAGTVAGAAGMGINRALGLTGEKAVKPAGSLLARIATGAKDFAKPKNLAAAGVLGLTGGVADYLAIKHSNK